MVLSKPLSRILYVDHDAAMRARVLSALTAERDWNVVTCSSGSEALVIVGQLRPDLILVDMALPRLDGAATLECLRAMELSLDTPVVCVAPESSRAEVKRLFALGATDVIPAPLEPAQLSQRIRALWKRLGG